MNVLYFLKKFAIIMQYFLSPMKFHTSAAVILCSLVLFPLQSVSVHAQEITMTLQTDQAVTDPCKKEKDAYESAKKALEEASKKMGEVTQQLTAVADELKNLEDKKNPTKEDVEKMKELEKKENELVEQQKKAIKAVKDATVAFINALTAWEKCKNKQVALGDLPDPIIGQEGVLTGE